MTNLRLAMNYFEISHSRMKVLARIAFTSPRWEWGTGKIYIDG